MSDRKIMKFSNCGFSIPVSISRNFLPLFIAFFGEINSQFTDFFHIILHFFCLLYLATRVIAQYCVGVFYFGPMIPEHHGVSCSHSPSSKNASSTESRYPRDTFHLLQCSECVTSGGLLSTNILLLWRNMAAGHAPLSKVARKNGGKKR